MCDGFFAECGYEIVVDDSAVQPFLLREKTIDRLSMNPGLPSVYF
jgi:hypothetical protein